LAAGLNARSPLDVLKKGYALVWRRDATGGPAGGRRPIMRIEDVGPGDPVTVSFHKGEFTATVESVDPDKKIENN
jgi:exonuclease VII large subunit